MLMMRLLNALRSNFHFAEVLYTGGPSLIEQLMNMYDSKWFLFLTATIALGDQLICEKK